MTRTRVVIDTDPGVDDAAAILLALARPELEVVGITTVAGNAPLEQTTRNALRLCGLVGADVPVAAGAQRPLVRAHPPGERASSVHGPDGLAGGLLAAPSHPPVRAHAIDLIAQLAQDGPLSIIAIAPLTNVALLLARHPETRRRIERIVIMGGARLEGNVTAAAEFNVWYDPEAAFRVLDSAIPVTLLPLDLTHQALLDADELSALAASGEIGALLATMIAAYGENHARRYGAAFAPLHDVLAPLCLACPDAISLLDAQLSVDCGTSPSRGATLVDTSAEAAVVQGARVGVTLDRERFAGALLDAVRTLDARGSAERSPGARKTTH